MSDIVTASEGLANIFVSSRAIEADCHLDTTNLEEEMEEIGKVMLQCNLDIDYMARPPRNEQLLYMSLSRNIEPEFLQGNERDEEEPRDDDDYEPAILREEVGIEKSHKDRFFYKVQPESLHQELRELGRVIWENDWKAACIRENDMYNVKAVDSKLLEESKGSRVVNAEEVPDELKDIIRQMFG